MTPLSAHIPRIDTARLTLRGHEAGDFDAFASMLADPRMRYMGGPFDRDAAWSYFTNNISGWVLHGFGIWTVTDRRGGFLGEVGFQKPDTYAEPELGWTLEAPAEGKGFAEEAARAALDWYWAETDASSVVSYVTPGNLRSERLAARLGALPDLEAPLPLGETPDETLVYRHRRPQ
jgi:RimJ/RimL family protein N-acetyltransferase